MSIKERHLIPIQGILVEVSEEVYTEYYRMDRRERYLVERDRENGVFSYHSMKFNDFFKNCYKRGFSLPT